MTKKAYFLDFEFKTDSTTFRPRFETEILVERAVDTLSEKARPDSPFNILDIGTGCGNIAISLTKYLPSSRITALDISDGALRVARKNAIAYNVDKRIEFIRGDLFGKIKGRFRNFFDLIVSNPPYVSLADFSSLPEEVKHDPYIALYGGSDGIKFYRRIISEAPGFLKEGAFLLMEIGYDQALSIKAILDNSDFFCDTEIYKDYTGIDRIIRTRKRWIH